MKNKVIHYLLIINLTLLAIMFLSKMKFFIRFIFTVDKAVLIPLFVSILIYYIIRPLDKIFIRKGLGTEKAGLLSLLIFTFILSGLVSYFWRYAYRQFYQVSSDLITIVGDKNKVDGTLKFVNNYIDVRKMYSLFTNMVANYVSGIGHTVRIVAKHFMNTFSVILLIVIMVYYLLSDGDKLKPKLLSFIKEENKEVLNKLLDDCDDILSHYVTGQAKVALSLAILIFIGYKIIGMPNAIVLASITFVLAFIPFVGFFIAMIIPVVISISMGIYMIVKLAVVFIVVQTLKGRIVVPLVMSKSMKIHPLTDIILVILAVALLGPFAAFAVVPIYAILKNVILTIRRYKKKD
ncbi:Predicted PurR-regulated permease PerM [Clostridium acidisoli DSM 12555]|uniref:Predicted PurR-regulated permease PerM n=1 Tax=Clostridium acidisoli DSM 12555 TaxID=1121291 RepID=A0A1W1XVP9_9CLOT|nr:AI-2E family transporter [Clostridium acidisoli]SMC28039.1 Predicted PurR-regulated permease PerM [Clostridium acidisoli DSM 12555]